jgi:3-oxoacyl-[acyl-carrier protein] reductase
LPALAARGWGRMINVTTSFFTMLSPGCAPYGPAKAALEAASAIWAKEFEGTGVAVNVLIPGGPSDTRMVPPSAPFARDALIPPEALAPPAQWLASPASDGVTGRRADRLAWARRSGPGLARALSRAYP